MKQPGIPTPDEGMNAKPTKRSMQVWIVIASTLVMAIYFGWQVLDALLMLAAAGVSKNKFAAYIPAGIIIFLFLVAAFAVYRGYRWSLFLYQIGVVFAGLQLLLLAPGLWESVVLVAKSSDVLGPIQRQLLFTMLIPIIEFAIALYGAIVVYQKIYSIRDNRAET
jgi:hypothetical protein